MEQRVVVIGDVHGCTEELEELLVVLEHRKERDRLVFAGDLVDRGPDSVGAVRRARELEAECVLGNHEEKHLRWRRWEVKVARGEAQKNPMARFNEDKLSIQAGLTDEDFAWLESLPLFIRLDERNAVVHGGCEPGRSLERQSKQIVRVRYVNASGTFIGSDPGVVPAGTRYWSEVWTGPETVYYGHAVHSLESPRVDAHEGYTCYGLDTGCVFGGRLTAAVLENGKDVQFVSVAAKRKYSNRPLVDGED